MKNVQSAEDLRRAAADLGLEVVDLDRTEPGRVAVRLRAVPGEGVIRRPEPEARVAQLRAHLQKWGPLGVVFSMTLDAP